MTTWLQFDYSEHYGILCEGHGRTPVDTLRTWLFPKRKNTKPLCRPKAWWQAQLALYGVENPKKSDTIAMLRSMLEAVVKDGRCDRVPDEILKKEEILKVEDSDFRREMFLRRGGNGDELQALDDPSSFLRRTLEGEQLVILRKFDNRERSKVHEAAQTLGFSSMSADAPDGSRWLIVGKDRSEVLTNCSKIERESHEAKEDKNVAKRKKLEEGNAQLMEMSNGKLDFAGKWKLKCDAFDSMWSGDDDLVITIARKHSKSKRLFGKFNLRVVEGVMKFKGEVPSEAGKKMKFSWRGEECGTGEVLCDDEEQKGWISLNSNGSLDGVFEFQGTWKFTGLKFSNADAGDIEDEWEDYDDEACEMARVSRWG